MEKVRLVDYFGFTVGSPSVPGPFPRIIVWGDEFFVANDEDLTAGAKEPRYHITTGYVVDETRERSGYV